MGAAEELVTILHGIFNWYTIEKAMYAVVDHWMLIIAVCLALRTGIWIIGFFRKEERTYS